MYSIAHFILKLRPAILAALIAGIFGLNRRRFLRTPHGAFFVSPASHLGITLHEGEYEPRMREVLSSFLRRGSIFMDFGANEGYFSVLASRLVGPSGTVISIEPQSRLQNVILANLAENSCYNVRMVKCALTDKSQTLTLSLAPETNTGSSSLFRQTRYAVPTETVSGYSLEDLLALLAVDHCDLAKIDIESAEYEVLMSSDTTLRKGIFKTLVIEIHTSMLTKRGLSGNDIEAKLLSCGYERVSGPDPFVFSFVGQRDANADC